MNERIISVLFLLLSHLRYTYFTHYPTVSKIILYVKIMCVLVRIRNPPNIIIVQKLIDIDVTECVNMFLNKKKTEQRMRNTFMSPN